MAKKLEFYEGPEAAKRFEAGMRKFLVPTSAAPKPAPPKRPQSSAK